MGYRERRNHNKSILKCGLSNAIDGTKDELLYEDSDDAADDPESNAEYSSNKARQPYYWTKCHFIQVSSMKS